MALTEGAHQLEDEPDVRYSEERPPAAEVIVLFRAAGLNGPLDQPDRVSRMIEAAQHVLVARAGDRLVGLVRVLTDFAYNAFVADLAVLPEFQGRGIGSDLLRRVTRPFPGVKFVVHPGHSSDRFYARNGFGATACMVQMRTE